MKKRANFSRGGMFMERWIGSAAVCVNERKEVLMVLQGKEGEAKRWSVPS
ncbi:NUDIX hydrolase, partial [Bacillus cereus]|nr:NUDIX hydrolase [Bacillus cereus]